MKKNRLTSFLQNPVAILLFAGLLLRVVFFLMFQPYNHLDEVIVSDADGYHRLALQFLHNGNFLVPDSDLDTFRTPGYPLFISLIYFLFGINASAVLFVQIFVNLASVFILYLIVKSVFNKTVGFFAALLFCFEPDHLLYIYSLITDTFFVFILLLSCLFLVYFLQRKKLYYLALGSFFTGIATLIRPISLLFPLVILFIIIVIQIRNRCCSLREFIPKLSIVIVVFGIVVSPWLFRNYSMYEYLQLSSISGHNLLNYNVAFTAKRIESRSIEDIRAEFASVVDKNETPEKLSNPFYRSKIQTEIAKEYIKNHKKEYIKSHVLGMINIYSSMEFKAFSQRILRNDNALNGKYNGGSFDKFSIDLHRLRTYSLSNIILGALYLLFLVFYYITALGGCLFLIKEKKYITAISILSVILYFTVLTGVVGLARYKLPISPFYIILSGYGIFSFYERWKAFRITALNKEVQ